MLPVARGQAREGPELTIPDPLVTFTQKEIIRIMAVEVFLAIVTAQFCHAHRRVTPELVFDRFMLSPTGEEIIHRGIVQQGLKYLQTRLKTCSKRLCLQDEKWQRFLRIQVSTLLFVIPHLFVTPQPNWTMTLYQLGSLYAGGVTYGRLLENCHTLSLCILSHATYNVLAIAAAAYPNYYLLFTISNIAHLVAANIFCSAFALH